MKENLLLQLAIVVGAGIGAQWLAWRIRIPSILLLLITGSILGPLTGFLDPDELLGTDVLMAFVSISVALILFEGGLTLRFSELPEMGTVMWRLVTVGALVTWLVVGVAAHYALGLDWPIAILLGAILVVTGPTVIGPLLRHVRPTGQVSSILKWEGIVIDPIGAVLAVLVFEVLIHGSTTSAPQIVLLGVFKTLAVGMILGGACGGLLVYLLYRYWIPDYLQNPAALALVIVSFAVSNAIQDESGLLTATVMGVFLANQKWVLVHHVIEFKENLRVLLLSLLFVLLAARLDFDYINFIDTGSIIFVLVVLFIARPLSVAASTFGSKLTWRQRAFLAWMAPRGIVAAAISSVFALYMQEANFEQAVEMVPATFLVIAVTVLVYGLTAAPVARWLNVAQPNPQGFVIAGAHPLARRIGEALKAEKVRVLLVDRNWANITAARQAGVPAHLGDLLAEHIMKDLDLTGIGRLLAMTPNDQVNSLAALQFIEMFGRENVYQVAPQTARDPEDDANNLPRHLRGRTLFGKSHRFESLYALVNAGAEVKTTKLTNEFTYEHYIKKYGEDVVPFFIVNEYGEVKVLTEEKFNPPMPGHKIIGLVMPEDQREGIAKPSAG